MHASARHTLSYFPTSARWFYCWATLLAVLLAVPAFAIDDTLQVSSNSDEFLPVEEAYQLLAEQNDSGELMLQWAIADEYYLYGHAFAATAITDSGEQELPLIRPEGKRKVDEYFGDVEVYYFNTSARAALPAGASHVSVTYQGCADAGLCYPPRTQTFALGAGNTLTEVADAPSGETSSDVAPAGALSTASDAAATSLLTMLLFAFLGGVVLNLMPCVFPVLALKVIGLVNAGSVSLREQRAHGLSYSAGVVVSFLLVAALLLALRAAGQALGWGFQLQTPWLVAALVYLFFVLGLGLSGYLEIGASWAGAGDKLAGQSGHSGSFFTGVLAVVVASPCTAPFMAAALGYALVQPAPQALLVFAALGVGMAAPFLLLVCVPALARLLPRPGNWMVTFKQVMAFPMYLTAVWLLWVVGRQTGVNGMAAVLGGCVLVFFAIWLWRQGGQWLKWGAPVAGIVALALLGSSLLQRAPASATAVQAANTYSAERVQQLRSGGQAVFVNLTADWCITCLANDRVALSNAKVLQAFSKYNVAYLKGDWTNNDPKITQLLAQYGRSGVPLYLLFPADPSAAAQVLPQILTADGVIAALQQI